MSQPHGESTQTLLDALKIKRVKRDTAKLSSFVHLAILVFFPSSREVWFAGVEVQYRIKNITQVHTKREVHLTERAPIKVFDKSEAYRNN